jgi:hypothetical protein
MHRVPWLFTGFVCCALALLSAPPATAQVGAVLSPSSRTAAQAGRPVKLSGWILAGQTINIVAVDQTTGQTQSLPGSVQVSTSGKTYHVTRCHPSTPPGSGGGSKPVICASVEYTIYPWTFTYTPADKYWAPQLAFAAGVPTSQGHLELFVEAGGTSLPTFSPDALKSMQQSSLYDSDPQEAALQFSDGNSTVLFDQYGVNGRRPATWTTVAGMISSPPPPPPNNSNYPSVAWSVGSYTVGPPNSGITIYALICAPKQSGNYPLVVYNHGGINYGGGVDGGSLHGKVTADGWTTAPSATSADDLGQCIDWAKRGWIFAMSSYRAESIAITSDNPSFSSNTWTSGSTKANGSSEFCMGEVTDVMALVNILVNDIGSITLGNPDNSNEQLKITPAFNPNDPTTAWNGKLFMYGYSHGGCITYRAVEQGAPVNAFAVIEGFTDMSLNYLNGLAACDADPSACTLPGGTFDPTGYAAAGSGAVSSTGFGPYYPDASGVMGYNWRSAHYFASRGDLDIQKFKSMPILILHGDIDVANPVPLDEPIEFAPDIGAGAVFYGPSGSAPPSEPCVASSVTVGAPIVDPNTHLPLAGVQSSCAVSFLRTTGAGDACLGTSAINFGSASCTVMLPPPPPPQHYMVVYHNMDHFNGGLGIRNQFVRFAALNFGRLPGCDGVPVSNPANSTTGYSAPIVCNGFY